MNTSFNYYKGWVKFTAKILFTFICVGILMAMLTAFIFAVKKYTLPVLLTSLPPGQQQEARNELPPPLPFPKASNVTERAIFGDFKGECFRYVEQAAAILPPTAQGEPGREEILAALIAKESSGDPMKVSRTGAKGCGQIVIRHHPEMAGKAFNPKENVRYAAKFLSQLVQKYGTYWSALPHYNGCVASNNCSQYRNDVLRLARNNGRQ
jgi:hypothetical protein